MSIEAKLALAALDALEAIMPLPRMPRFRHFCKPCRECDSTGDPDCLTCSGQSTPCDCEARYEAEGDRRYDAWRNGDHDHDR